MSITIAITNQKGGVGKTTSTLNLGAALNEFGHRTLLVDLDPQGSLTVALGYEPEKLTQTVFDAMMYVIKVGNIEHVEQIPILKTKEGFYLLPANLELSKADRDIIMEPGSHTALRDILLVAQDIYDYILLDCPPTLGILTANALSAADSVIIPLQADYLALKGVNNLLETVERIQRRVNRHLTVGGIFITMADTRLVHTKDMITATQEGLGDKIHVFDTIIRLNTALKEAPVSGKSILSYDLASQGARLYRALAQEIITVHTTGN